MTGSQRGTCTSCKQERQIVAGGVIRQHSCGTRFCPGSRQPPMGDIPDQPQPAPSPGQPGLPDEPTYGRSCDGGGCNAPSIGWRWYRDVKEWLPVCGLHMDGPQGRTRIYDQNGKQQP